MSKCTEKIAEAITAKNIYPIIKKHGCGLYGCKWENGKCIYPKTGSPTPVKPLPTTKPGIPGASTSKKEGGVPWWVWLIVAVVLICCLLSLCSSLIKLYQNKLSTKGAVAGETTSETPVGKTIAKKHKKRRNMLTGVEQ